MSEVFEEQYGYKPIINALHAGVECGLFSENFPDSTAYHLVLQSMIFIQLKKDFQ